MTPFTSRRGLLAAAGVLAVLLPGVLIAAPPARLARGDTPPDFTATALDGRRLALADLRGRQPVLLLFYGAFAPSRRVFPLLRELDERLSPRGLRIVAISQDETRQAAAAPAAEHRAKFPVVFDPEAGLAGKYGVQALPHAVLIDRAGKVHAVVVGVELQALERAANEITRDRP